MTTIDQRVVQMKFDNAQFAAGVKETLADLQTLNKSMKFEGATKGLSDISTAAQHVQLGHIASSAQTIADKFKTMSVVGIAAITSLTNRAVTAGTSFVKSFTISPIIDGFHEYETNLNSIQTILANTGLEGEKGLGQVTDALNDLNHYADKTIYNFSEMARNIGTFTAAGVDLKTSTAAIKGIANLAAVSGSNSQQASSAMYQLSQALSAGKVSLEDWNSVVQAGMGGKVFRDSLIETARTHGINIDKMIKDEGGFRNSLQKGWLTSKILTETLSKFTGDLTVKQLKSMGYSEKQITQIQKMGKTAQDAATKVKTMSQLFDTLKEAVGSGWAATWQTLFGNFTEARTLFTNVSNVLGGFINSSSDARNKVLNDWKALGGRTVLIKAISNAFHALIDVLRPIRDAFREIFPPTTGKQLLGMTVALEKFTEKLKIGSKTSEEIKRTFAGFFAVLGIGWDIVKGLFGVLAHLFGVAGSGSGGFLKTTASIGDFLVKVHDAIEKGGGLVKFFRLLGIILAIPIKLVQKLASAVGSLFDKFDNSKAQDSVAGMTEKLGPLGKLGQIVASFWGKVLSILGNVSGKFAPLAQKMGDFFGKIGSKIADGLGNLNFDDVLNTLNTSLFAGLVLLVKKIVDKFTNGGDSEGGLLKGFIDSITEPFDSLTKTLSAMQNTLKATTLIEIAIAIGIMTLSVSTLSKIDAAGLTRALTAMTIMFTQLYASMAIFNKISSGGGFAKMSLVTGAMILLAIAIDILASAVKKLADLDWNGLAKGLVGVTVLIGSLVGAVKLMPEQSKMISSSLGLVVLAFAIKLLANSVTKLAGLSWDELAKGLIGVGTLLGGLVLFTKFNKADKGGITQGAGIILLATGIKILASAMKDLGKMSWGEIAKGLVAMGGGLVIIGAALDSVPPSSILSATAILITATSLGMISDALGKMGSMSWGSIAKSLIELAASLGIIAGAMYLMEGALPGAAALIVVAASLGMITEALQSMGNMSWGEIAKSLVELAGALTIIALAMIAMTEALPGAAALLVVAASLAIMAPILQTFGDMSWEEIAKGLLTLAGVFVILGAAGVILTPLIPSLIGLGVAITLIGIGIAAAGAGVFLFAAALTALSAAGAAGTLAIVAMVSALAGLIPLVMKELGLGIVAFANVIAVSGPSFTKAITAVLLAVIVAIGVITPKLIDTLLSMLSQMLSSLEKYTPKLTSSGAKIVTSILNGLAKNMSGMVKAGTNVVVSFINAVSRSQGKVVDAGFNLIIKFINSLSSTIRNRSSEMGAAGANLSSAIIEGMARGLAGGVGRIAAEARNVAKSALDAAKGILGINSPSKAFYIIGKYVNDGFAKGLKGNQSQIDSAFGSLKKKLDDFYRSTNRSKSEKAKAKSAYAELTKNLDDEHAKLDKLSKKYDKYTQKIKDANDALADSIKTRDDYNKSITDQFSTLPTIDNTTTVDSYKKSLQKQLKDTQEFATDIQKLRKAGLNDEAYKQLLSTGPSSLPFIRQLLAGGSTAIGEINNLDKQLSDLASSIGKTASTSLYQAGVDAAQGLVNGLKKQQAAIQKVMDAIADKMVKAIKDKLHIKSPSQVFADIGGFSAQGLADGLSKNSWVVEKSAADVGNKAVDTLQKSLLNVSDLAWQTIDSNPTIKPVLDLSDIQKSADEIGSILDTDKISVDGSLSKAQAAQNSYDGTQEDNSDTGMSEQKIIKLTQNNYSPKALSPVEIYRQTNNLLSKTKEALDANAV